MFQQDSEKILTNPIISYKAPDPYSPPRQRQRRVFSTILAKMFLPALTKKPIPLQETVQQNYAELSQQYDVYITTGEVVTYDGATLTTIEISPSNPIGFIIKFKGQKGFFESTVEEAVRDAVSSNTTIICFNYRGVGHSTKAPDTFQDLITDGISQVQRLLDQDVKGEQILLDGESFGGAIATFVAFHFHKKNIPVYLFNSRSFAKLSEIAIKTKFSRLPAGLQSPLERLIAHLGWEANSGEVFSQLPQSHTHFMFLAPQSQEYNGDSIIPNECSLFHHLITLKTHDQTNKLISYSQMHINKEDGPGHSAPREKLFMCSDPDRSGQDVFLLFTKKIKPQNEQSIFDENIVSERDIRLTFKSDHG